MRLEISNVVYNNVADRTNRKGLEIIQRKEDNIYNRILILPHWFLPYLTRENACIEYIGRKEGLLRVTDKESN